MTTQYTHILYGLAGIGLQVTDLQLASFAYYDQYLVRFKKTLFIKNIGYYEEGDNLKKSFKILVKKAKMATWRPGALYLQNKTKRGVCNHKTKILSGISFTVKS